MTFADLRLAEPILDAVAGQGYTDPTPIQAQTIPGALAGRDVLGSAQTGTGKTAAFALPLLHRLALTPSKTRSPRRPRCLVLCPTRELAAQIGDSFATYGKHLPLKHTVVFGGVKQNPQVRALGRGVEILVATPGRLLDLMNQGHIDLSRIEALVLDEADRMLDMGFIRDIERVVQKIPRQRQTLLFSATMPPAIRKLAGKLLRDPVTVDVVPHRPAVETLEQQVYFVAQKQKPALLTELLTDPSITRALVFTRTKHGADRVVKHLVQQSVVAEAIHGNKTQKARQLALKRFRDGQIHILVATDIASRGIDVDAISHVISYDLTHDPETHVHRIGRTARAGASGVAVSFCSRDERSQLSAIERFIGKPITVATDRPDYAAAADAEPGTPGKSRTAGARPRNQGPKRNAKGTAKRRRQPQGRPAAKAGANDAVDKGKRRSRRHVGGGAGAAGRDKSTSQPRSAA